MKEFPFHKIIKLYRTSLDELHGFSRSFNRGLREAFEKDFASKIIKLILSLVKIFSYSSILIIAAILACGVLILPFVLLSYILQARSVIALIITLVSLIIFFCFRRTIVFCITSFLKRLRPRSRQELAAQKSKRVREILENRDRLEEILQEREYKISLSNLDELIELDERLEQQSHQIAQIKAYQEWKKVLKKQDVAWWNFQAPVHLFDRLDWLWGLLTIGFLIVSLALAIDLVPRFWIAGPSVVGSLAVIGPVFLSWLFGKESLEKAVQSKTSMERVLEKVKIPAIYRQEFMLITSFFVFLLTFASYRQMHRIANMYYQEGWHQVKAAQYDGLNSKEFINAESNFSIALAFDPDHKDARANLGWIYEMRQDFDKARNEYNKAAQNGSLYAHVRLARLKILMDKKRDSPSIAANLLRKIGTEVYRSPVGADTSKNGSFLAEVMASVGRDKDILLRRLNSLLGFLNETNKQETDLQDKKDKKSWTTILAWARLEQGMSLVEEAKAAINQLKIDEKKESLDADEKQEKLDDINQKLSRADYFYKESHKKLADAKERQEEITSQETENRRGSPYPQPKYNPPATNTCIEAGLLEAQSEVLEVRSKISQESKERHKEKKNSQATPKDKWCKCQEESSQFDPDMDYWLSQAEEKCQK
jgi:TPR repeat protein